MYDIVIRDPTRLPESEGLAHAVSIEQALWRARFPRAQPQPGSRLAAGLLPQAGRTISYLAYEIDAHFVFADVT